MKIVHVRAPRFSYEGTEYDIDVIRVKSFAELDERIQLQELKGKNVCLIYGITNLDVLGERVKDGTIIVRCKFIYSEREEMGDASKSVKKETIDTPTQNKKDLLINWDDIKVTL